MITSQHKEMFNRAFEPVGRFLIRLKVTPNQLTCFGLILAVACCVVYMVSRNAILFVFLISACGLFDALDGVVARLTQNTTKFGSYLDALCDRLFDTVVGFSVAYVTGYWVLMFFVTCGALTISYAKARAAMEVSVSNTEWPDWMERGERSFIFLLGLLVSEIWRIEIFGQGFFFWVLVFLVTAMYATVIQRAFRARSIIESRSGS